MVPEEPEPEAEEEGLCLCVMTCFGNCFRDNKSWFVGWSFTSYTFACFLCCSLTSELLLVFLLPPFPLVVCKYLTIFHINHTNLYYSGSRKDHKYFNGSKSIFLPFQNKGFLTFIIYIKRILKWMKYFINIYGS